MSDSSSPLILDYTLTNTILDIAASLNNSSSVLDARLNLSPKCESFIVPRGMLADLVIAQAHTAQILCKLLEIVEAQNGL